MAESFVINYQTVPKVSFSNITGMKNYLLQEREVWGNFLNFLETATWIDNTGWSLNRSSISAKQLAGVFDRLEELLIDVREFNLTTVANRGQFLPPPPSSSLEGRLALGLAENDLHDDALAVYIHFLSANGFADSDHQRINQSIKSYSDRGRILVISGKAASVLPFQKVSSQKLSAISREAGINLHALKDEVQKAHEINVVHEASLTEIRTIIKAKSKRIVKAIIARERVRGNRGDEQLAIYSEKADLVLEGFKKRHREIERAAFARFQNQKAEFQRLKDLFYTQLRLKAPVALWKERADDHSAASKKAFSLFLFFIAIAIIVTIGVPYFFGDYISSGFFEQFCTNGVSPTCERVFSAKGPLTLTGLLVSMSLILWIIRLQFKIHLSERHLALDASEKKAFAETYMAMKEGSQVADENEAIILASLFRPTQDGIIKDDGSGVDLSVPALIARQLGRGSQ